MPVEARGDPVIEDEGVPRKPSARLERRGHAVEGAAPIGPRRQVKQGSKGAVDQRGGLFEDEIAHVAETQIEVHARRRRTLASLRKHLRRRVDTDDAPPGRARHRNRDTPVPDRELDDRSVGFARQGNVERHVGGHMRRPLLVDSRVFLVPGHRRMLRSAARSAASQGASEQWKPLIEYPPHDVLAFRPGHKM